MAVNSRFSSNQTVALTTSAATTPEIGYSEWASGTIYVPTGSSITSLTFHAAPTRGGTFIALQDSAATPAAVVLTVEAAKAYPMPEACLGCRVLKLVANAAGSVEISLKG